ncbi:Predicted Peptidoglycan domain-containing protein [Parasphingorhabdus marina DSM 22363]|uniref:Predicted Peptidoglycan domain-containing protein n=1 Tax=Parasphingorhabdus marina DSM 22363 TaxID=1123272 RepID=A0A1N6GKB9_9SPHN|nr:glycosyl hydrolase 108 family protein [Parasphingorhabdus marina]SIO07959.1 Predicted Peptidoglycan domain-containing protein [Parasphingorhabdus marina DSM 22363]
MNIDRIIDNAIAVEGGYSDHPADRGGPTRWGITEKIARQKGYVGDMRHLPKSVAKEIYKRRYWSQPGFDRVHAFAPDLAVELFDTGINMGPGIATGFLQRALNALNRQERDFNEILVDKILGNQTIGALQAYLKHRGKPGEAVLLKAVEALQGARYIRLAEKRPANEAFLYGWLANRIS